MMMVTYIKASLDTSSDDSGSTTVGEVEGYRAAIFLISISSFPFLISYFLIPCFIRKYLILASYATCMYNIKSLVGL